MRIFKVFSEEEVETINALANETQWKDGKATAKGYAKEIKENFQITDADPLFKTKILPIIAGAHRKPGLANYSQVRDIISPRLASYHEGGHYDWHVDTTLMQFKRTDLSFTIFLRDPSSYDGGHMEIEMPGGMKMKVKGKLGEMVIYPSGFLHKVHPVTKGERRVVVGWLNSHVKSHEHRERLYEMLTEIARIKNKFGSAEAARLNKLYYQFLRDLTD